MYKASLWEHSIPLFNRPITVPCRAKLSATHQHLEIKTPSASPATAAVGVRWVDRFRGTTQTGLPVEGREKSIRRSSAQILFIYFEIIQLKLIYHP